MVNNSLQRLVYLCETIPPVLYTMNEHDFSKRPSTGSWSKKEILGHLLDSASNNHQRFVRVQFEDTPSISYDPDKWNNHSYYNLRDSKQLISFWTSYNKHLAELAQHIPAEALKRTCKCGEKTVTLAFLITDYVEHLEHHLKQIINYE